MLSDDTDTYPMTFPVRIDYTGTIIPELLTEAREQTLKRHPLLDALIQRKHTRPTWKRFTGEHDPIIFDSNENPLPPGLPIDLTQRPGVRIAVAQTEGGGTIHFLFHHAACDGIGGLRFAGDVLSSYGQLVGTSDSSPRFLPLDPENLKTRGIPQLKTPPIPSRMAIISSAIRESFAILRHRPVHLPGGSSTKQNVEKVANRGSMQVTTLSADKYGDYCSAASHLGVTVNDLLLRDLFLTASQWIRCKEPSASNQWIRIAMPTALFGPSGASMPAANCLGFSFLTRRCLSKSENSNEFLENIAKETSLIRKWQLGSVFVDVLRRASKIPGLLFAGTRLSTRFSTLVLSNLGNPIRRFRSRFPTQDDGKLVCGDLIVDRIVGVPPIRPGTRGALALFTYRNNLDITFHGDPHWFSRKDGEEFLFRYLEQIEKTLSSLSESAIEESSGSPAK